MLNLFRARLTFCLLVLLPAGLAAQAPQKRADSNRKRSIPRRIAGPWSAQVAAAFQRAEKTRLDANSEKSITTTDQDPLDLLQALPRPQQGNTRAGKRAADPDSLLLDAPAGSADPLDDLLAPLDETDPLDLLTPKRIAKPTEAEKPDDPHVGLWTETCYPSAETCRKCHPKQYEEWRASGHAYATISPMYQRFEQAMTDYTRGTVGSFCVRCHSPVATQLKIPRSTSVLDAPQVVREGVTCISCHRIREHYGRSHGDRRIEPGDIYQPVGGGSNGAGLAHAINDAEKYKLKTSPHQTGPGQPIHRSSYFFKPLTNSDVCTSCHQVAVHPGIWLEVVHARRRTLASLLWAARSVPVSFMGPFPFH